MPPHNITRVKFTIIISDRVVYNKVFNKKKELFRTYIKFDLLGR